MSKMQMLTITVTYAEKVHFFRQMKIEMVLVGVPPGSLSWLKTINVKSCQSVVVKYTLEFKAQPQSWHLGYLNVRFAGSNLDLAS